MIIPRLIDEIERDEGLRVIENPPSSGVVKTVSG
jgi:hypothetical protein